MAKNFVITIARGFGSDGKEIALPFIMRRVKN